MITSDFQLPAGVCLRFGSLYGYMYKCNNGRMSRIVWRDSIDCMGKYSFIDENYCSMQLFFALRIFKHIKNIPS